MFSEEILAEIRERINVVDFISEHVQLKKAGKNFKGLCPFHPEKTPSFMVSPERQTFHCFGCATGGNVFHFLMKLEGVSFPEAVLRLGERAGVAVEKSALASPESRERRSRALEIQRLAAWYYHCLLKQTPKTEAVWLYLIKRGITDSIAERFHLGYCPPTDSGLQAHLLKKGVTPQEIQNSDLYRGQKEFFRGRFLFPIFNHEKKAVALGGRLFNEKDLGPKYLNSPESEIFKKGELFYGFHLAREAIRQSGQAIVVEGYLDVIALHTHGFAQAIAPLGTGFTPHHGKMLKRFASQVTLLFDADTAGQDAALRALDILLAQGIYPDRVTLDPGEDPDSSLRRFGRLHFEKKLGQRRNLLEDLIDKASASIPRGPQNLVQKGQAARRILALLEKIPDSIVRNLYKRRLAETFEIPESWLTPRSPSLPGPLPPLAPKKRPLWLAEEETIFEVWMKCPELRDEIVELVDLEDFCTEEAAHLAQRFWQKKPSEAHEMTGHYFDLAEPGELEVLSEITMRPSGLEETQTAKNSLYDSWYRLKWKKLQSDLIRVKKSGASEEMDLIHEKIQALSQWFKNKARLYGEGKSQ